MEPEETVEGLKRKLAAQTNVPEKRQKLLGLKTLAGKPPLTDDTPIYDLALKPNQKIMLLGQADEAISELERQAEVAPHVQVGPGLRLVGWAQGDGGRRDDAAPLGKAGRRCQAWHLPLADAACAEQAGS